jgi:autotransporter strand-loop-strand O-heptosyltransferase
MWSKTSKEYFVDWLINVYKNNKLVYSHNLNFKNKRVYISLESKAIGDTIAWFPYIEEFRKKWNCEVICSTFHNDFFINTYKNIKFVKPGEVVHNIYAQYTLGWYYKDDEISNNKHITDVRKQPMQKAASDILGLNYEEIRPNIFIKNKKSNFSEKYVVIAPHSTALAKYWNHPKGWQIVINYLNSIGYKVVLISKEKLGDSFHDNKLGGKLENVIDKTGENYTFDDRITDIYNADFFIGLGSGLSWLSWALETPTILISGFSEIYTEFTDCERIFPENENVCTGCFNNFKLDASDWNWCPVNKNTDKMFECTKTILPIQVIDKIDYLFKKIIG